MAQLHFNPYENPHRLVVELRQDPLDVIAPVVVTARITGPHGELLGACSISLAGLELDHLDTVVQRAVECYRYSTPQNLMGIMRYEQRQARRHARQHAED